MADNLALGSLALGSVFGVPGSPLKSKVGAFIGGIPLAIFGLFLVYQTTTLRFTFDDTSFSLVKSDLSSTGENVVVGGENVWKYTSFVNYDFFPSESFPILVYFKETQTPKEFGMTGRASRQTARRRSRRVPSAGRCTPRRRF